MSRTKDIEPVRMRDGNEICTGKKIMDNNHDGFIQFG